MILAASFAIALVLSVALWAGLRDLFNRPLFLRENYRGVQVPTGAGIILAVSVVFTQAALSLGSALGADLHPSTIAAGQLTATAVVGFALLGLLDDVAADTGVSGYLGHGRALLRGKLTGGGLKLIGGGALALVVVAPVSGEDALRLVLDAALVALAANLANLLDRAPGRVTKVGFLVFVVLAVTGGATSELAGAAIVVGATLGLFVPDLREELMLGDAGANPLGGALGLGIVLGFSPEMRTIALVVVVVLNLASEAVSFTSVIERVGPLRYLDGLGRRERRAP
jgi:UDP-GlcNAc:undecaprenyl-phosphate/decaprenyl-phosphate GlcNAc-1-phosphate transferase